METSPVGLPLYHCSPQGAACTNSTLQTPTLAFLILTSCITHPLLSQNQIKAPTWNIVFIYTVLSTFVMILSRLRWCHTQSGGL